MGKKEINLKHSGLVFVSRWPKDSLAQMCFFSFSFFFLSVSFFFFFFFLVNLFIVQVCCFTGRENNFRKYEEDEILLLGTPYDYGGVMHYGPYGFAIDPEIPTIYTCDPDAMDIIGQRVELSALDIERVQVLYGCLDAVSRRAS